MFYFFEKNSNNLVKFKFYHFLVYDLAKMRRCSHCL